jgi:aspartyl-tRNA synthetase
MQRKGLDLQAFDFYLDAFKYGMPPHGGWGLGVERMVQKMLDLPNIRETILFPRDRIRLVP